MQADHLRLAAQELFQGPKLRFATDERGAAPLGDRRGDDRSITARAPCCKAGSDALDDRDGQPAAHLPLLASVLRDAVAITSHTGSLGRSLRVWRTEHVSTPGSHAGCSS